MSTRVEEGSSKNQKQALRPSKKKPVFVYKTAFDSPYNLRWSSVTKSDKQFVLESIKGMVGETNLSVSKGKKKRKRGVDEASRAALESICIGINEVTRGLEKDLVQLVVIAKDREPSILTAHLPVLCAAKQVPVIFLSADVPGTTTPASVSMGGLFGLKRVVCLALKKSLAKDYDVPLQQLKVISEEITLPWSSDKVEHFPTTVETIQVVKNPPKK